ncbi:MAG: hypothetical protein ACYS0E_15675 [Planctomycetota bacterium]|jgi:hypothetical protein
MLVQGLAPFVPPNRPRAAAVWWCAQGTLENGRLLVERLEETNEPAPVTAPCGIAAPLSLPDEFVAWAGEELAGWSRGRLFAAARTFAARRTRGSKHPLRDGETHSVLDRRRLALYHAAIRVPRESLIEVDIASLLRKHDLPSTDLSGASARSIARRSAILRELEITLAERDYAVASWPALAAVLACYAAAVR